MSGLSREAKEAKRLRMKRPRENDRALSWRSIWDSRRPRRGYLPTSEELKAVQGNVITLR